jgi:hypothetical protein
LLGADATPLAALAAEAAVVAFAAGAANEEITFASTPLMTRLLSILFALALVLPARGEEPNPIFDKVPMTARVVLGIRSIEELQKKGDDFLKAVEWQPQYRPSEIFRLLKDFTGLGGGPDPKKGLAFVLVDEAHLEPRGGWFGDLQIVAIFPATPRHLSNSYDKGIDRIESGKILQLGRENLARFLAYKDGFAYVGDTEKGVRSVLDSKPMVNELTEEQRKNFANSDVFLSIHPRGFKERERDTNWLLDNLSPRVNDRDDEFHKELAEATKSLKLGLASFEVDSGLSIRVAGIFDKTEASKKFLARLNTARKPDLNGLPEGKVVFAQAVRGDGNQTAGFVKGLLLSLLDTSETAKQLLNQDDQAIYLGVFNEIWKQLKATRIAFYQNEDIGKHGLLSGIVIVETEDAPQFVRELKRLAKFSVAENEKELAKDEIAEIQKLIKQLADVRFRVRESATNQLMLIGLPALKYLDETIAGGDADLVDRAKKVRESIAKTLEVRRKEPLSKESISPLRPMIGFIQKTTKVNDIEVERLVIRLSRKDATVVRELKELFGPTWDHIPVATVGKQTVFLFGSNESFFEKTLTNLQKNLPGLAKSDFLVPFEKHSGKDRKMDLHFSMHRISGIVSGDLIRFPKVYGDGTVTSLGLTVTEDRLQLDSWIPIAEFKSFHKSQGW